MALIECQNVSYAYEKNIVASNLNFQVEAGDYLCIIGENGSGKSTLIKGLLNLKMPHCGNIKFRDHLNPREIGYLPQQTAAQKDFPASVYEVVVSGRLNSRGFRPFYSKKDKQVAIDHMKQLGIIDLKNKCYRELSGGQQQRVLLARALCATKKLLLLDEPVSGLDPLVTKDLYQLIFDINKQSGITIIMVSHDIQSAIEYASHILHLNNHQLFFGEKEEYVKSTVSRSFLGGEAIG